MPFYDLQCQSCENEYKVFTTFEQMKQSTCPDCGSEKKEQVYKANIKGPLTSSSSSSPTLARSGFS